MSTAYQTLVRDWKDCRRCHLCAGRRKVVMARGDVPCDLLFVGEAPGESENVVGRPMVGPAGQLFDHVLERAVPAGVTYLIANLVGCIPRLGGGDKAAEPDEDAIQACRPRLESLVRIAEPRLIFAVGKLAGDWLQKGMKHSIETPPGVPVVNVMHPAYPLRANVAVKGLLIQKMVVTIAAAIEALPPRNGV